MLTTACAHTNELLTSNTCFISINYSTIPREGAYVHGMYMEGARWDTQSGIIVESRLKELFPPMPVINIRVSRVPQFDYILSSVVQFIYSKIFMFWSIRQLHKTSRIYVICINVLCIRQEHAAQLMCGRSISNLRTSRQSGLWLE